MNTPAWSPERTHGPVHLHCYHFKCDHGLPYVRPSEWVANTRISECRLPGCLLYGQNIGHIPANPEGLAFCCCTSCGIHFLVGRATATTVIYCRCGGLAYIASLVAKSSQKFIVNWAADTECFDSARLVKFVASIEGAFPTHAQVTYASFVLPVDMWARLQTKTPHIEKILAAEFHPTPAESNKLVSCQSHRCDSRRPQQLDTFTVCSRACCDQIIHLCRECGSSASYLLCEFHQAPKQ